ncbi:MAG: outer membrane lipoprotein-sorting protein [Bdellovibrionota bacterium]|nr:outer membrane lipoprotein-sorting protein [Bdellovibrionota bacterium]
MLKIVRVFLFLGLFAFLSNPLVSQEKGSEASSEPIKEEKVDVSPKDEKIGEVSGEVSEGDGDKNAAAEKVSAPIVTEEVPEDVSGRLPASVEGPSAEDILKRADEVRNPSDSFFMKVKVTNKGEEEKPSQFDVSIKGNNRTLIKTLLPKRDRGRNLLMLDENMWVFIPNLKRSVRVGLSQKLTGQAANGDISRMRWSGDYTPKLLKETKKSWLLHLQAKKKGLTYEQLKVLISKKGFRPRQAHLMSVSGKLLKKIYYQGYKKLAGRLRPSQMNIVDAINDNKKSLIEIEEMEARDFQTALFNKRNLAE